MKILKADIDLLHVPLARPRASPLEAAQQGRLNHVVALVVQLRTDGPTGLGFAYALQSSGRALLATAEDDLAPLVVGEDPLDHERLGSKAYWRTQTVGRRGLVQQAWSAFDVALWDLKGKAAGLPLHKLLGGARSSCEAYGSDTAWLWMSVEEIVEASKPYLSQGMKGLKVKVGGDADADLDRLTRLREELGDDVWLAVDANERYDRATALTMGRFFEEEVGVGWFEEPISCEDVEGHALLAKRLDLPLAAGEMLFGADEFLRYAERDALAVWQPDVTRLGGITPWLKVAAMAEARHLPVSPHLLPEIGVQLGCGLPVVTSVEWMPWLGGLFANPPALERGRLVPPPGPGLGLELHPENLAKWKAG
ncbi:MAG: mandelate racemase/muconate lactonizing enzyme family protein [Gemmataceae bacterium]|nr:mandelate racemase/muconate lactonizing enzyme family protein [Gemmataceae bacterium]